MIRETALAPLKALKSSATVSMTQTIYTKRVDQVNITRVDMFCDYADMEPFERLRKARIAAGFKSARNAAVENGWKESSYAAHENGQNGFDADGATKYGRAFKASAAWLMTGEGPAAKQNIAKVMGRIGAGAEILPEVEQVPPDGLFEIEVPFPIPDDAQAYEVQGDSMWPRYDDRDIVICWRFGENIEDVLGWEAALLTTTGKRYLKRIIAGSRKGLVDLESFNAPVIRGVRIEWAARVQAVVRRGQWSQLTPQKASSIVRPMKNRSKTMVPR